MLFANTIFGTDMDAEALRDQHDGISNSTFVKYKYLNGTTNYDRAIGGVLVVYTTWRDPNNVTFGGSVTCLGMQDFAEDSRSLKQVLNVAKTEGDSKKGISSLRKLPWAVVAAAIAFAL